MTTRSTRKQRRRDAIRLFLAGEGAIYSLRGMREAGVRYWQSRSQLEGSSAGRSTLLMDFAEISEELAADTPGAFSDVMATARRAMVSDDVRVALDGARLIAPIVSGTEMVGPDVEGIEDRFLEHKRRAARVLAQALAEDGNRTVE